MAMLTTITQSPIGAQKLKLKFILNMLIVSALNMEFLTHTLGQTLAMRRARTGQDRGYVLHTMWGNQGNQ